MQYANYGLDSFYINHPKHLEIFTRLNHLILIPISISVRTNSEGSHLMNFLHPNKVIYTIYYF